MDGQKSLYSCGFSPFRASFPFDRSGRLGRDIVHNPVDMGHFVDNPHATTDFMTADWTRIPYEVLHRVTKRIITEVPGINRVCYDLTPKPTGTIEWE